MAVPSRRGAHSDSFAECVLPQHTTPKDVRDTRLQCQPFLRVCHQVSVYAVRVRSALLVCKATCVRSHVCRLPRMKARGSTTRCHCMLLPRTLAHDPRLTTWTSMYVHLCLCVCVTCDEHARVSLPSLSRRPLYCAKHRVKAPGARDVVNLLCCWTGTAAPSSRPRDLPDLNASAHVTLPRFPRAPCASLSNTNSSSDICMRTGGQHADEARSRCTDSVQEDDISPHTPAPGSPSPSPNSTTTKRAHTSEKVVRSHTIISELD